MGTSTLSLIMFAASGGGNDAGASEHAVTIFIVEVALMLLVGRLLGEVMQRMGQPAVMGQLVAGVLLGPSVLGALSPSLRHAVFPDSPEQKRMIDALSQFGVLMLLLLTGMETDLALVNRMKRTAVFTSLSGIILPFACGFTLGEYIPEAMLPDPSKRLATALFLATALSISSVKIVAMVIMEVGFLRRTVGQIILASAILDDTIGWIIIAIIGGIAGQGKVNLSGVGMSALGTAAFLVFSFTLGRRAVAYVIRWTNDNLTIDFAVITAILVLMCAASLATDFIGVHTVLGAFVVGILVGQSPILTGHIEEQLRGLIVALFMPVFFATAGLSVDLSVLRSVRFLELALGFILIASFGKVVGCYVGGRLGGLGNKQSTALAIGMNARGSTEVIVATVGLSMGVLTRDIFTLIVVMAITTTLITPPLLRWALSRIPPTGEEKERLEREEAEAKDFVPSVERLLIGVDRSANGELASTLAGYFVGTRKVLATVVELGTNGHRRNKVLGVDDTDTGEIVKASAEFAARQIEAEKEGNVESPSNLLTQQKASEKHAGPEDAILSEAKKGFDMLFLGVEHALEDGAGTLSARVAKILQGFDGVTGVVVARGDYPRAAGEGVFDILVPATGTDYSRRGAEVAVAIAKACKCGVTAMHVSRPADESVLLRRTPRGGNDKALLEDIRALGEREGVRVKRVALTRPSRESAILRRVQRRKHNLVVLGVKARPAAGDRLFVGQSTAALVEQLPCSVLIVIS
ncbi:MAG TPA: cation:proton antiporter [Pyrinomonadaceae bacterium]|nr:cation:proton antiporter [Pyrinomonadaceae bacterium]